jgi:hypothetical protein
MSGVCELHNEFMKNINNNIEDINKKIDKNEGKLDKIDDKLDLIIETNAGLKMQSKYIEKNLEEHKSNSIIHISKWWIIATVMGAVIAAIFKFI